MNRQNLLKRTIVGEKDGQWVDAQISEIEKTDRKFLKRTIDSLEKEIEDNEEKLEKRLTQATPIDTSVVESIYGEGLKLKEKLKMYKSFQKLYNGKTPSED